MIGGPLLLGVWCAEDAGDGFGAVVCVGLGEDLLDVPFDRAFGQEQSFSDGCVGEALGDQLQDLDLAWGERCVRCRGRLGGGAQRELLEFAGASLEFGGGRLERFLRELGVGDVLHDPDAVYLSL